MQLRFANDLNVSSSFDHENFYVLALNDKLLGEQYHIIGTRVQLDNFLEQLHTALNEAEPYGASIVRDAFHQEIKPSRDLPN
jgi:hypothetical protein